MNSLGNLMLHVNWSRPELPSLDRPSGEAAYADLWTDCGPYRDGMFCTGQGVALCLHCTNKVGYVEHLMSFWESDFSLWGRGSLCESAFKKTLDWSLWAPRCRRNGMCPQDHDWRTLGSLLSDFFGSSPHSPFHLLFILKQRLTVRPGWSGTRRSANLCLWSARIKGMHYHALQGSFAGFHLYPFSTISFSCEHSYM